MTVPCDHMEWVYPPPYRCDYTGEMVDSEPYKRTVQKDIDVGRFQCQRCKEIGYYTGSWREHWEGGRKLLDERTGGHLPV